MSLCRLATRVDMFLSQHIELVFSFVSTQLYVDLAYEALPLNSWTDYKEACLIVEWALVRPGTNDWSWPNK